MFKAVFIDYTGTTVHEDTPEMTEVIGRVSKHCDLHDPRAMMKTWIGHRTAMEHAAFGEDYITEDEITARGFRLFTEQYGLIEDLDALNALMVQSWSNAALFSDAKVFFEKCPLPIYVISNNSRHYVEKAMADNDLHPAGIICADDARAYKPRRELFEYALHAAGCRAEEAVHIGDSYHTDVLGARAVGIRPMLVVRKGEAPAEDGLTVIRSLPEALELLK